ncbi:MAG: hypothetical protein U9R44_00905 [Candidatus Omnitrophota bacterium]|nr:hypothetical protein [Candidatus Omnitrophota bacterium]
MKRFLVVLLVLCLFAGSALVGCGPKKAATSQEAIKTAQAMDTKEKKTEYLMDQAEIFLKARNFQETINLAQYVLWNLDSGSSRAKDLLRTAKDAMAVQKEMQK